jgi:hypothetical protein
MENNKLTKPPLGLRPRFIVDELRLNEITQAINRRLETNNYIIPIEWVEEYNDLIKRIKINK